MLKDIRSLGSEYYTIDNGLYTMDGIYVEFHYKGTSYKGKNLYSLTIYGKDGKKIAHWLKYIGLLRFRVNKDDSITLLDNCICNITPIFNYIKNNATEEQLKTLRKNGFNY